MKLVIVRHGETDWNREGRYQGKMDIPLNEVGLKQAHLLAEALSTKKIDLIFSSPLRRALDTAKAISFRTGTPLFVRDELREIHFGEWEGLLVSEVKSRYPESFEEWRRSPDNAIIPSGETLRMVLDRVKPLLELLLNNYAKQTVVIVGHGGINRVIICHLLGLPLSCYWKFRQDNACLSILESLSWNGGFYLKKLNDTCHLLQLNGLVEEAL